MSLESANYTELDDNEKRNILRLISHQDSKRLKALPLNLYNLNYLIVDTELQFDEKISPLLSACFIGKIDMVITILDNEAVDVNLESYPEMYTPLMIACFKGFYEITRLLLDKNANVNKINRHGQKPLLFCFSRLEEVNFKYENKKICMMLVDLLLSKGADINVRIDSKLGYTVLMKLVYNQITTRDKLENTLDIISFMIERGADSNIIGFDNKTVFEVINPSIDNQFKQEIIRVLKNTNQIYYFGKIDDELGEINSLPSKSEKNIYLRRNLNNFNTEKRIVVETTETRISCCSICIYHIYYFI